MAKRPRWTVNMNIPGYLPLDEDPPVFKKRVEAERFIVDAARDQREAGYKVSGNAHDGYHITDPEASENHLGWNLSIYPVEETND